MDSPRRLILLHPSPWSERARWALEHHGLAYTTAGYLPIVGEIELRRLARGRKERLTVPALVAGEEAHCDSWDIALYADREGQREKLVPPDLEEDVRGWNDVADSGMGGVRARVLERMLDAPEALDSASPPFLPRWLRPVLRPAARWTVRRLQRNTRRAPRRAARTWPIRGRPSIGCARGRDLVNRICWVGSPTPTS